ncbi:MAG: replication-associated recombination protein A [Tissierellia bacterium]|nr:replication-associated recombination protein A [Tissierellia bacterium]
MDLFDFQLQKDLRRSAPLAERLRPQSLGEMAGQSHVIGEGKYFSRILEGGFLPSILLYGPPGIGKTTLAELLSLESGREFVRLSAVTSNVKELREVLGGAEELLKLTGKQSVLFLDEIHRFTKSQQDVLLPYLEKGKIVLIGATTENPYFYMNQALLSRMQVIPLYALSQGDLEELLQRALEDEELGYGGRKIIFKGGSREALLKSAQGDGRALYNALEILVESAPKNDLGEGVITPELMNSSLLEGHLHYDRDGNQHYDTISAFIKSIRGSDPDAAIFYLAKMLSSGEDPEYIARRLIISASEDISNADPHALPLAVSAFEALRIVGMPEGRIPLAQATTYLASAPKSDGSYQALNLAMEDVKKYKGNEIPSALRDPRQPLEGKEPYKNPHRYGGFVPQRYLPLDVPQKRYYQPTHHGHEGKIREHLDRLYQGAREPEETL